MTKPCTVIAAAILAVSVSGLAFAQSAPEIFSVKFRYDGEKSVNENYSAFVSKANRICSTMEPKLLVVRQREQACADDVMSQLVLKLGRSEIAALHREATGKDIPVARDFATK